MRNKTLIFDMDGTIANLYEVKDWLKDLRQEVTAPYNNAEPLFPPEKLNDLLHQLKNKKWSIVIVTWSAKGASTAYTQAIRDAKIAWLDKYKFPYDEIHIVNYGVEKSILTQTRGGIQILFDDDENVRNCWTLGKAIDPRNCLLEELEKLLDIERSVRND